LAVFEAAKDSIVAEDDLAYNWSMEVQFFKGYTWIVHHPHLLGGQPAIRGTRISVAQALECLSIGMTAQEIADDYPGFPPESVPEVLKFAAQQVQHVAA
jgi:uncharacterized protein (DUF433 family)